MSSSLVIFFEGDELLLLIVLSGYGVNDSFLKGLFKALIQLRTAWGLAWLLSIGGHHLTLIFLTRLGGKGSGNLCCMQ